jgi:hypothetical protein
MKIKIGDVYELVGNPSVKMMVSKIGRKYITLAERGSYNVIECQGTIDLLKAGQMSFTRGGS